MKGIYKITNNINNKCYIGKSVDVMRRLTRHKSAKLNTPLYNAFRKHGLENFTFEVLHDMGEDATEDDLLDFEYLYKLHYKSFAGYGQGYNQIEGREDPNHTHSQDVRDKISKARKGIKFSDEHKKNISKGRKGIKLSDEHKKNIGNAHRGMKRSQKTKDNISAANSGEKCYWFGKFGDKHNSSKNIIGTNIETGMETRYGSMAEAGRAIGKEDGVGNISSCCNGKKKTAYGHYWRLA